MRHIRIFVLISFFSIIPNLNAETWYARGTWEYFFKIEKTYFFPFENCSMKQEKIKDYPDGTILAKNTAILNPKPAVVSFPLVKSEDESDYNLTINYPKDSDKKYLADLASSITNGVTTLDEAVEKIVFWVRNNVTYSLGAPMDAIGVIKAKRAFCVGYAEVMCQLLRSVGIRAHSLDCYIPPGHGWGFGNEGGYHAFIEYWYPGAGWYSVDPQSQLDFSDPFHIVYCPQGFPRVSDVRENNNLRFVDHNPEPKSWATYLATARSSPKKSVFAFNIKNASGSVISHFPLKFSESGTEFSLPFFGHTTWYDGRNFSFEFFPQCAVVTNTGSGYYSIIVDPDSFKQKTFRDTLIVQSQNYLMFFDVSYTGAGDYLFDADASDPAQAAKLVFYDKSDTILANSNVSLRIKGRTYSLYTDQAGAVYLKTPAPEVEYVTASGTIRIVLSPSSNQRKRTVFRVPEKAEDPDLVEKAIETGKIDGTKTAVLAGITIDEMGLPSGSVFDRIVLFGKSGNPIALKTDKNGIFFSQSLIVGKEYSLLASKGNRHIRKKILFGENGIKKIRIDPGDEEMSVFEIDDPNEKDTKMPVFEYIGSTYTIEYATSANRIYFAFPDGEYVFSTSDKGRNLYPLDVKKEHHKYTYSPESVNYDTFISLKNRVFGSDFFLTGRVDIVPDEIESGYFEDTFVSHPKRETDKELLSRFYAKKNETSRFYTLTNDCPSEERMKIKEALVEYNYTTTPLHSGAVTIFDSRTKKSEICDIEESGFFATKNIYSGSDYCFWYSDNNRLNTKNLAVREQKSYSVFIDNILKPVNILAKKESGYTDPKTKELYLLFPSYANNTLNLAAFPIRIDPYLELECSLAQGVWYLAPEKRFAAAILIDTDAAQQSYFLFDDADTPGFPERKTRLYESVYRPETQAAIFTISIGKQVLKDKTCMLVDSHNTGIPLQIDKNGLGVLEKLERTKSCTVSYFDNGIGLEYDFTPEGSKLLSVAVDSDRLGKARFVFNHFDGFFSRVYPVIKNDSLDFRYAKCILERNNDFTFYAKPGSYPFIIGKNRTICFFTAGKKEYTIDSATFKADQFEELKKLFTQYAINTTIALFRGKAGNSSLNDFNYKIRDGSVSKNSRASSDGIGYVIGIRNETISLESTGKGYFYRKAVTIRLNDLNPFEFDVVKEANLKITKILPKKGTEITPVYLYKDPVMEKDKVVKSTERIPLSTDDKGAISVALPPGDYAVEANGSVKKVTIVSGKISTIGFPAAKQ